MLSNRLISIQNDYKSLRTTVLISLMISIVSCSTLPVDKNSPNRGKVSTATCKSEFDHFEGKNLVTAAQIKSSVMGNCFRNYLRFEQNKKQTIGTCNQISIRRGGKVNYVQVTNLNRKSLPKDLKMCMKQEYWKMDFSGLQLERSYIINFPLTFTSK